MTKTNDGTRLQKSLQKALEGYCSNNSAFWYRFPDTRAAGRFLQVQPGDYQLLVPGKAILIECKSTDVGEPFHDCLTNKAQLGKHRLWHRAGHPSYFVFADYKNDLLQLWDGQQVLSNEKTLRRICTWAGAPSELDVLLKVMIA